MRKTLKILIYALLGFLIIFIAFVQYLKSDFNDSISQFEIESIQNDIKTAKELPSKFVEVYGNLDPITNTTGILYDWTFENYNSNCPCLLVASMRQDLTMSNNEITGNRFVLAWKLEKAVSQVQCLNFLATHLDFLYNNVGIETAAQFYFKSNLESLTVLQMKTLTLMFRNASLYNPIRHLDTVEQKLNNTK